MKYFITGGTGFIGGELARQLREQGHEVIALVRNPAKALALSSLGVQLAQGDVTEPDTIADPMTGCDGVFHVAGWYKLGLRDKRDGVAINIHGTRNVLAAMQRTGVPKGVYTSTLAVHSDTHGLVRDESYHFTGRHLSEYDRTKAAAHEIAREFIREGLPLVIAMPGLVYGPGDTSSVRTTIHQLLLGKLPVVPRTTAYCWGHVSDIAQAHILAMQQGRVGESYIISGPCHTLEAAIRLACVATDSRLPMFVPGGLLRAMAPLMQLLEKVIPLPAEYTGESMRVIGGTTYLGDNTKARRELGYAPRSLEEGWVQTVLHEKKLLEAGPS